MVLLLWALLCHLSGSLLLQQVACCDMVQGECALDAENIVKLFTMDMVDQQKVEEYLYEVALQVGPVVLPFEQSCSCGCWR